MRFRVWRLGGFDSRSAVSRAALAALALWSSVPVQAAPPPGEAGCKVWNVQVGPSVFAIPYTPNLLAPPMVHVGDDPSASPWLREQVRCDDAPVKVWSLDFALYIDDTTRPLVKRGELPEVVTILYPAKPPDYMGFLHNTYKIDPALVKTPCRDGFDTEIAPRPAPAGVFGCRKDSGRALIWTVLPRRTAPALAVFWKMSARLRSHTGGTASRRATRARLGLTMLSSIFSTT